MIIFSSTLFWPLLPMPQVRASIAAASPSLCPRTLALLELPTIFHLNPQMIYINIKLINKFKTINTSMLGTDLVFRRKNPVIQYLLRAKFYTVSKALELYVKKNILNTECRDYHILHYQGVRIFQPSYLKEN
jgi:hypothetical protein